MITAEELEGLRKSYGYQPFFHPNQSSNRRNRRAELQKNRKKPGMIVHGITRFRRSFITVDDVETRALKKREEKNVVVF